MKLRWLVLPLLAIGIVGCEMLDDIGEDEEEIALSSVPQNVLDAAKAAVPGITLTEAEVETEDGATVYEVEGMADGKEYEIEVSADGKVLEVEQEDEDDDD